MMHPDMAIPPWHLAAHVAPLPPGQPVELVADRAFRRWLPEAHKASLVDSRTLVIAGRPALCREYRLTFGNVTSPAIFAWIAGDGYVCQIMAQLAWDAGESDAHMMRAAHARLCDTVVFAIPRRDALIAAQMAVSLTPAVLRRGVAVVSRASATGRRIWRQVMTLLETGRGRLGSSGTAASFGAMPGGSNEAVLRQLRAAYDITVIPPDSGAVDEETAAREIAAAVWREYLQRRQATRHDEQPAVVR